MLVSDKIYLGQSDRPEYLDLRYANRHGLITGATGTGKTVTLQVLAERGAGLRVAGVDAGVSQLTLDIDGQPLAFQVDLWSARGSRPKKRAFT